MHDDFIKASDLVRDYEGLDLYKIGTHIPERSTYNHNYYKMPNGTIVILQNDDEGCNMVSVEIKDNLRNTIKVILVGEQWDNGLFHIGENLT